MIRTKIVSLMKEIAAQSGLELVQDLNDNTILLESGLDSLSFAILVAKLEEELGYDPFTLMDEPVYPQTLIELISIYEKFSQ